MMMKMIFCKFRQGNQSIMYDAMRGKNARNCIFIYVHQGQKDDCVNLVCLFSVHLSTQWKERKKEGHCLI